MQLKSQRNKSVRAEIAENAPKELVVRSTKGRKLSLMLLPIFGLLAYDAFSLLNNWSVLSSAPGARYIKLFLVVVLLLFLGRLIIQFCKFFKRYMANTPAAVLKEEGLWLEGHGLIPWENVQRIEKLVIHPLNLADEDIVGLGICLKNPEAVFNRHWLDLRVLNRLKKSNAKHHILLQQLDLDPHEIAQFAQQFIR